MSKQIKIEIYEIPLIITSGENAERITKTFKFLQHQTVKRLKKVNFYVRLSRKAAVIAQHDGMCFSI